MDSFNYSLQYDIINNTMMLFILVNICMTFIQFITIISLYYLHIRFENKLLYIQNNITQKAQYKCC